MPPGAGLFGQAVEAMLDEAGAPLANRRLAHPELGGDATHGVALDAVHDDRARMAIAWAPLHRFLCPKAAPLLIWISQVIGKV